jgi:hypothetical protein
VAIDHRIALGRIRKIQGLMLKAIFFAREPSPPGVLIAFGRSSRIALVAVSATGQQGSRRAGAMLHVVR